MPSQPWLDGYCVARGEIRQFVAMPLGSGYSAEEQLTGQAEHGGLQLLVRPLRGELWRRRRPHRFLAEAGPIFCLSSASDMGLAPGGRMRQEIYDDDRAISDYDADHSGRCFVHLANALVWRSITGQEPPTTPPTAEEYTRAGLPWFDYYAADRVALEGGMKLKELKSVVAIANAKNDVALPEKTSVDPHNVIKLRAGLGRDEVRAGVF